MSVMTRIPVARWTSAAVLALTLGLAGCSSGVPSLTGEVAPAPEATAGPADGKSLPQDNQDQRAPGGGFTVAAKQIARTGSLTLSVKDPVTAAAQLTDIAEAAGGLVSSENIQTNATSGGATSRIVLSVPSARLGQVMDDAAKVGELRNRGVTARDITTQVADVDARIRTLQESIARIRLLMKKTGSIADIAQVEAELTQRQAELESMLAQQKVLRDQVEMAPITVTLLTAGQVTEPDNPLLAGLKQGWEALLKSVTALLVIAGAVLPFALVGSLIVVPIVWWRRRVQARTVAAARPATAPSAPQPPAPSTPAPGPSEAPAKPE